jgi:hypothetical protein
MFEWFGVWSKIKSSLGKYAKGKVSKLLSKLKDLRASTTNDLAELIADSDTFRAMGINKTRTRDRIADPRDTDAKLELSTIPVSFISSSGVLATALATKLGANVDMNAARNTLGVSNQEWSDFVARYAASFVEYATPIALAKLIDSEAKVYGGEAVLAIAENEAYKVNGVDGYHDMVKFIDIPSYRDRKTEIKKARTLWNRRKGTTYTRNV